jgi:hypothetical protein
MSVVESVLGGLLKKPIKQTDQSTNVARGSEKKIDR